MSLKEFVNIISAKAEAAKGIFGPDSNIIDMHVTYVVRADPGLTVDAVSKRVNHAAAEGLAIMDVRRAYPDQPQPLLISTGFLLGKLVQEGKA